MLTLREFHSSRVSLGEPDAVALAQLARTRDGFPRILDSVTLVEAGTYAVRPLAYVGRFVLPSGLVVDLQSRFAFHDLIELLRVAGHIPAHLDMPRAPLGHDSLFIDLLALAIVEEVETIVARGLAKGYRTHRFERPPYPGRPDVVTHLRRHGGRPDRLVTTARRLTIDTQHNRALATGLDLLLRIPLQARIRRQTLLAATAFRSVRPVPTTPDAVRKLPLDKLTARYVPALELVALLLEGTGLVPAGFEHLGPSVIFGMPRIWEACVARWVSNSWPSQFRVEAPHAFHIGRGKTLAASADVLVLASEGHPIALYDAKYKGTQAWPDRSDVYQMLAYCEQLGLREATLVYPFMAEERQVEVGEVTIRGVGIWDSPEEAGALGTPLSTWAPPNLRPSMPAGQTASVR